MSVLIVMLTSLITTFITWGLTHESGPVYEVWLALKNVIYRALDPIFGFTRKERERENLRVLGERVEELVEENQRLHEAQRLLLDGTPGKKQDLVPKVDPDPSAPAWGSLRSQKPSSKYGPQKFREREPGVFEPDEKYVRRLERDRDELQARLDTAIEEIDKMSRTIGRMHEEGTMPMARYTTDTAATYSPITEALFERRQALHAKELIDERERLLEQIKESLSPQPLPTHIFDSKPKGHAPDPKVGVINRIANDDGTFDVFLRFEAPRWMDEQGIAERAMERQARQDDCIPYQDSLFEDVVFETIGKEVMRHYTYRYRCRKRL